MHVSVQFSQRHLLNRLSLLHCMFLLPLSYINIIKVWVYFWALYLVPLIYVSVLMPVSDCSDYSGLVLHFDIRYCDPSCFVLLSQDCCSYSGLFMVPYKFLKCLFYIYEICHWYCNRYCIESINCLGCMDILMMLILPIREHGTCFHLFVFLNFFLQCCVVF